MHQDPQYIDIRDLFRLIWMGKYVIIVVFSLAVVVALVLAVSLPNKYKSETKVRSAEASEKSGPLALEQLSALGGLAGFNMSQQGSSVDLAIAVLQSREFLVTYAREKEIVADLLAVKSWDSISGKILYDRELYDPENALWVREVSAPLKVNPGDAEIYEKLKEILSVEHDPETGFVEVSITHLSPQLAYDWTRSLIERLNEEMRKKAVTQLDRSISYLTEQMEKTQIASLGETFRQILQTQIRDRMLADARPEYALETIDPPFVPQFKSGPNRALIVIVGGIIGGILGVLLVFLIYAVKPDCLRRLNFGKM